MTNKKINPFHIKSFAQKVVFIILSILVVLLVCTLIVVGVLLAWSPGKVEPFLDKNGETLKDSIAEKLAYEYMLEQYKSAGNKKMIKKLEAFPITESDTVFHSYQASFLRDEAMHDLGIGTMHNMKSVVTGIFLPVMQCRAYTLGEKINIWRGKAFLNKSTELRNQMHSTDLTVEVPHLDIPVYFFSGIHDYTVSYSLTEQYLEQLQAPTKGFYTFEESAHSPLFEEPEKFILIMQEDVLNVTTNLADTK